MEVVAVVCSLHVQPGVGAQCPRSPAAALQLHLHRDLLDCWVKAGLQLKKRAVGAVVLRLCHHCPAAVARWASGPRGPRQPALGSHCAVQHGQRCADGLPGCHPHSQQRMRCPGVHAAQPAREQAYVAQRDQQPEPDRWPAELAAADLRDGVVEAAPAAALPQRVVMAAEVV